ncbi:LOW QUALITY PROTEIN: hypothetical protein HZS_4225 [Henneguya salminicola]|nr:LOW QUALITY PROTEIN: hypothetical protein HZS_4225 [Henneguya salminicola]
MTIRVTEALLVKAKSLDDTKTVTLRMDLYTSSISERIFVQSFFQQRPACRLLGHRAICHRMKQHNIMECMIWPAWGVMAKAMFGDDAKKLYVNCHPHITLSLEGSK